MTTRCRSCGAECVWATTEKGSRMLVDAAPASDGTVQLVLAHNGSLQAIIVLAGPTPAGGAVLHRSHFATCPDAADWRRR